MRQMHRRWRRAGARARRGREENDNRRRDGGRRCFENNRLGDMGREREKGEGVGVHMGAGEEGRREALCSGRQRGVASSGPQPTGVTP
jgi:hypothetical protein